MATNPNLPFIQKAWEVVLPVNDIVNLGSADGLKLPYTLNAVALAQKHEDYDSFVLQIDDLATDRTRRDKMICGTVPIVKGQPKPPTPPILIFLFDGDRVRCLPYKLEKNVTGQRQLFRFDGTKWAPRMEGTLTLTRQFKVL